MKTFTVQIDGTNPKNWRKIEANDPYEAIAKALECIIAEDNSNRPSVAYVVKGPARHANGSPVCVQSYALSY